MRAATPLTNAAGLVRDWPKNAACAALMSQHHRGAGCRIGGEKGASLSAHGMEKGVGGW